MSIRQDISDKMVKELYRVMSSPHFMRLSNVLWRVRNEFEGTKSTQGADITLLMARIAKIEDRMTQLQAKLEALEGLMGKMKNN